MKRRDFIAGAAALSVTSYAGRFCTAQDSGRADSQPSPKEALARLVEGNRQYASGKKLVFQLNEGRLAELEKGQHPFEMPITSHIVIMFFQSFQAYLVKSKWLDSINPLNLFAGGRIAQIRCGKSPLCRLPVQFFKIRMEQRIATGERHLTMNIMGSTEFFEIIKDGYFLL